MADEDEPSEAPSEASASAPEELEGEGADEEEDEGPPPMLIVSLPKRDVPVRRSIGELSTRSAEQTGASFEFGLSFEGRRAAARRMGEVEASTAKPAQSQARPASPRSPDARVEVRVEVKQDLVMPSPTHRREVAYAERVDWERERKRKR